MQMTPRADARVMIGNTAGREDRVRTDVDVDANDGPRPDDDVLGEARGASTGTLPTMAT